MDNYGILGGYEDGLDEDDEEGSRGIPSRTSFGAECAFVEKFPEYGRTRRFLFGLVSVRSWGYRCELTIPQIEIMQSDLPHTLYKKKSRGVKGAKSEDIDEATRLTLEAMERKKKIREEREKKEEFTMEEIFEGAIENEENN